MRKPIIEELDPKTQHVYYRHDPRCDDATTHCYPCMLACCAQCGEAEMGLADKCPGRPAGGQPFVDVVFDGPPGAESGRFVEVEDQERRSIALGQWVKRHDGYWVLRITRTDLARLEQS